MHVSQRVLLKFHVASEELREKTGLGSFSNLDGAVAGAVAGCRATRWLALEWMLRMLNIISQLGVPSCIAKVHSSTEQDRGRGGAMAMAQAGLLDHFSGDIIDKRYSLVVRRRQGPPLRCRGLQNQK